MAASPEQNIFLLRNKLKSLALDIESIANQGRTAIDDRSQLPLFKGMFRTLDTLYNKFTDKWDSLIEFHLIHGRQKEFPNEDDKSYLAKTKAFYYESQSIYAKFESQEAAANLTMSIPNTTSVACSHAKTRLPKINLPRFSGNLSEWPLYRDSFKTLVDDDVSLSRIEKYHFLIGSLTGSALALVKSIPLLEANYDQAWKVLYTNYNNRRKLGASYINHIVNFKLPSQKPTPDSLKSFLLTVSESVNSFYNLHIPENKQAGFILFELAIQCLDPKTREAVELELVDVDFPQFSTLEEIVQSRYQALSMMAHESETPKSSTMFGPAPPTPNKYQPRNRSTFFANSADKPNSNRRSNITCFICNAHHALTECPKYISADPPKRLELLKSWPGCRNCLYPGHKTKYCPSTFNCRDCGGRHHTTLHLRPKEDDQHPAVESEENNTSTAANPEPVGSTFTSLSSDSTQVLLGTAYAHILDASGSMRKIRLIVDSGSQFSFITSDCVKSLGLIPTSTEINIAGIGQSPLNDLKGKVKCILHPIGKTTKLETEAVIVPTITPKLPQIPIPATIWKKYLEFNLADPTFYNPGPVDFLMGADLFMDVVIGPPVTINSNEPKLLQTILGFIVSGKFLVQENSGQGFSLLNVDDSVETLLPRFWQLEEVPVRPKLMSPEEIRCEDLFQCTHYRLPEGRYVVSLPFKANQLMNFSSAKERALKRFYTLEAKLSSHPKLKREYTAFMDEYIQLGHMQKTTHEAHYVIPHHAVYNPNSLQPKLRVVFDGSAKASGKSLNDLLLPGPKLQNDIADILLNFRGYQFVLTADVVKMYRQIQVLPLDRPYQHILWRADPSEEVAEYELTTVTYGLTSSPYLALRVINQLVSDEGEGFPLASHALTHHIYVDDVASGSDNINDLKQLKAELIELLAKGCFNLSKWATNCPEILSINEATTEPYHIIRSEDERSSIKILGMRWDWKADSFCYCVDKPEPIMTKRAILSCIARIYDPLGYIAPIVFLAKVILQDTWKAGTGWNQEVPPVLQQKWLDYLKELPAVSQISIPRYISTVQGGSYVLIGFCDASEKGYCATVYLKIPATYRTFLLKAKTKLAPVKIISVPRLELCAAVLLARLIESIKPFLAQFQIDNIYLFTDSTVVIGWLNSPSHVLKTFVAHRVELIKETTKLNDWKHVVSEHNPADLGSRGVLPSKLAANDLWWTGPPWLSLPETEWPESKECISKLDLPETKACPWTLSLFLHESPGINDWMTRFSHLTQLLRTVAYVQRFLWNTKKDRQPFRGPITFTEYNRARLTCVKLLQHHFYPEIFSEPANDPPPLLRSLNAFVDEEGVLRVGGRLSNSNLPVAQKHPILLPRRSPFTTLVVKYYHQLSLHTGAIALQAFILQQYWIPGVRSLIKQIKGACKICYLHSKRPPAPFMGNLPAARFSEWKPFHHTGIDFAGPFLCRETARRKSPIIKAYLCLFICLSVKAVHLETVSSLSTESFLDAFERFAARRGVPSLIVTDCGTNFVGASRHFKEVSSWLNTNTTQNKIVEHTTPRGITWQFNPPHAPHFGGIWEANIKVVKTLLHKTVGSHSFTYDELNTIFTKIEGIMNSRPLTPLSTDADDLEPLTPAHFLVGGSLLSPPDYDLSDVSPNSLSRWQLLRERIQHFWIRWRNEYLTTLQKRQKWTTNQPNLEIGDLVLLLNENPSPSRWPLARVTEIHQGDDNVARVATIKTATGVYKRPAVKLLPLKPILARH